MIGLMYLLALLLYLALSVAVVVTVGRWAKRSGKRRWAWMTGAGTVMYLLVFWDLVPTIVVHRYLCSTYAGMTIHKTPEVWLAENRGRPTGPLKNVKNLFPDPNTFESVPKEGRLAFGSTFTWHQPLAVLSIRTMIVDRADGSVLVEHRSVEAGSPKPRAFGEWRRAFPWLWLQRCEPEQSEYIQFSKRIQDISRELP
jgi:hypothetical protein